jgi:hypothetical protein
MRSARLPTNCWVRSAVHLQLGIEWYGIWLLPCFPLGELFLYLMGMTRLSSSRASRRSGDKVGSLYDGREVFDTIIVNAHEELV